MGLKGNKSMKVIEVNNLSKDFKIGLKVKGFKNKIKNFFKPKYNVKHAVDDISFAIDEGEAVAFIGPNGAGKSTTIKMLTGILYPTSGSISVLGLDPSVDRVKLSYLVGTVFGQKEQLWVHLSPMDNFKFFGAIYDIDKDILNERIEKYVNLFDISKFVNQPVKSLSLGQRMKCEMVASLLNEPKILFFDEPTIGLDPVAKDTLRKLIKKINKELGTTILFTSHDVGDIETVCKRVIIINDGKIVLDDTMRNLKYHYLNKKLIQVKMSKKVDLPKIDGMEVIKSKDGAYEIEADMDKVTVDKILSLFSGDDIEDITISSTPLEDIIKNIYQR